MSHPGRSGKIYIVIPAYNEQAVIRGVVRSLTDLPYHIIVVDDGSVVSPEPLLHGLPIYLLRHGINLGQGAALQTGIGFALEQGAELIVTFDADGQHEPADIQALLNKQRETGADIVLGSRFMGSTHHINPRRKILLQLARYVNYAWTGLLLSDAHNGLRVLTAYAARSITLHENGMAHATELLLQARQAGLRVAEAPVRIHYTEYSKAKGQSGWNGFRILFDLFLNKLFR